MSEKDARAWLETLANREPPQRLAPKRPWDAALSENIANASFGAGADADALRSALLLWNDDLDGSHELSQRIETPTGSLLHGVMHRMEGDYGNAEYWFRRVGAHPCYRELAAAVRNADGGAAFVPGGAWDPYAFNRAVERAVRSADAPATALLERLQRLEMSTIAAYCLQRCFGGTTT
ncbi:hypothetical protein [Paenibacillus sp.]|uniref:hypothetical protein n=1 Tax=Paenibacillus sp. TaxID=58172 RepID=UPI002D428656|nr:hypothetical protein [Paenibacillus sp.]HZG56834.1 hypothetical protein [Paenibacillus sp.]